MSLNDFDIEWVFHSVTPQLRAELVAFWLEQAAISNPYEAWRRSHEVACIARDVNGEIVAVSSVYSNISNLDGYAYWMYRTFVRPDSRLVGLAPRLFEKVFAQLHRQYGGEKFSPQGVIVILENEKLKSRSGLKIIRAVKLSHWGKTSGGQDVWVRRFSPGGEE